MAPYTLYSLPNRACDKTNAYLAFHSGNQQTYGRLNRVHSTLSIFPPYHGFLFI
jgi:hypothetical protein